MWLMNLNTLTTAQKRLQQKKRVNVRTILFVARMRLLGRQERGAEKLRESEREREREREKPK